MASARGTVGRDRVERRMGRAPDATVGYVASCPGSLIVHFDGTVAGCTLDDDEDVCRGRELRHEGSPIRCVDWSLDGCTKCGVHN